MRQSLPPFRKNRTYMPTRLVHTLVIGIYSQKDATDMMSFVYLSGVQEYSVELLGRGMCNQIYNSTNNYSNICVMAKICQWASVSKSNKQSKIAGWAGLICCI